MGSIALTSRSVDTCQPIRCAGHAVDEDPGLPKYAWNALANGLHRDESARVLRRLRRERMRKATLTGVLLALTLAVAWPLAREVSAMVEAATPDTSP